MSLTTTQDGPERLPAPVSEGDAVLGMIERVAADTTIDIARVRELMTMHRELRAERAAEAFAAALSDLQADLPVVIEHGKTDKAKYARWEDIVATVKPHLAKHGFSISFEVAQEANHNAITGILRHRQGHEHRTTLRLPTDTGPGRNAVQAIGSSVSYGKRYVAMALLNITTRGDDDDGRAAVESQEPPPTITDKQLASLRDLLESEGITEQRALGIMKLKSLDDLLATKFNDATALIKRMGAKR